MKKKKNNSNQVIFAGFGNNSLMMKMKKQDIIVMWLENLAHWSCNINLQLTKKVLVIFHNVRGYGSHLIFPELTKFDVKIEVILNILEKYITIFLNKNLVFIDSMQFMNSILEKLVKSLSDNDFKCLTEEFGSKNLELLRQKDAYPYDYMDSFKRFGEKNSAW